MLSNVSDRIKALYVSLSSARNLALLALVVVCFVGSLSPICVKWSEKEISAIATVFDRFLFGFLVFSAIDVAKELRSSKLTENEKSQSVPSISLEIVLLLLGAGFCAVGHQVSWAVSLYLTNIGNSALLHSLAPLFTALFAWLFFKQRFERQFLLGMAVAIGGVISIGVGDFQLTGTKLQGDGLALLSAVFFAGYLTMIEELRIHMSASSILLWRCLLGALLMLPIFMFSSERIIPLSVSGWLAIACLTTTFAIVHWLLAFSLVSLSSTFVGVVVLLEPFLSSIQAWLFFSENLTAVDSISFVVVIVGVYLAIRADKKSQEPELKKPCIET
ncbi:DMT family transporter [Scytonema hofmannii FACHB-248]|uniref:DMT family transporter n=1 Tax=Scytonema hofmannii FACHB-248 TaxID=1842502 RepID=A0ABR8GU50_9CYAN|nr:MULTISPECIES: DMT family transporter [Nostocales]MBD2607022.1 DMT family transporter [Scytonema hofmannii FACHB-248]